MMREQLTLHTLTHLRFYLRSRLVLGLGLTMLALWSLQFVPFLLMESSAGRFAQLKIVSSQLHNFIWLYGAVLALLAMSSHLRDRSTRLVFTRPASPDTWIASVFLSAFLVSAAGHAATALVTLALSVAWNVPFQVGFAWTAAATALQTLVLISIVGAAGAALHPAIAALGVLFFNEGIFYQLMSLTAGTLQARGPNPWIGAADWALRAVYKALPMMSPFSDRTRSVEDSLRVTSTDWLFLAASAGYTALIAAFCFLFAAFVVRRKEL